MRRVLLILTCIILPLIIIGCGAGKSVAKTQQTIAIPEKPKYSTTSIKQDISCKILDTTILFLPSNAKILKSIPTQNVANGVALIAEINNDQDKKFNPLKTLNVLVGFEKDPALLSINSGNEEKTLDTIFNNYWKSMENTAKVATNHKIISKDILKNIHNHKYLRVIYTSSSPNKPNREITNCVGFYVFGDTLFMISLDTFSNNIHDYSNTISDILYSFSEEENGNEPIPWLKK